MSNALREANVTVIDRKICNDAQHYNFSPVIDLSMICAGGRKGEDDSCEVSKLKFWPFGAMGNQVKKHV